ncbi:lipopolysaccharide biosynthesis protein [Mucilaginibacter terrenus]|uniref:Lipopolysaccharide biosynthesis protein n=1 Tax=Mucilaginibacter terrenus TaxID=2482727 RepID=A0A3E2NUY3_9SPHI|nr:lipopolysaccharide biosynthesis protein [Mucilaginibacter terrenus]RFZ84818.1 lipopolysaccharide biosynthesis protein [Mucilaginibacter terrenus]
MGQPETTYNDQNSDEISMRIIALKVKSAFHYIGRKWLTLLLAGLLGAGAGVAFSIFKKPVYTATSTFVLEEEGGRGGGLGQYAGLASLAGIDMGRAGGGIFQGDNILQLYKSRVMIEKTLLSEVDINGKRQLLIDRYINFNKLRKKWKNNANVTFTGDPAKFNRVQDSIISDLTENFNKNLLSVTKPDKKLSIINVDVKSDDEYFAKAFNNKLVETVNNFYTFTKTKKSSQNLAVLQRQADSVKRVLGYSISGVASAIDASPNANPAFTSLKVPSQKKQVDVQASSAIYAEIVKNLEISKISLRQETPLIQIIDQPVYPLPVNKLGKAKAAVIGFIVTIVLTIAVLIAMKMLKSISV